MPDSNAKSSKSGVVKARDATDALDLQMIHVVYDPANGTVTPV